MSSVNCIKYLKNVIITDFFDDKVYDKLLNDKINEKGQAFFERKNLTHLLIKNIDRNEFFKTMFVYQTNSFFLF